MPLMPFACGWVYGPVHHHPSLAPLRTNWRKMTEISTEFFGFLKSLKSQKSEKNRHFKEEHEHVYTLIRHHTFTFINLGQINLVSSKNPSSAPKVLQVFQVSSIFTGQAQQPAQNLSNFHPKLLRNVCTCHS